MSKKLNILYIVHNLGHDVPESKSTTLAGGSEITTYHLAHSLSDRHNCYIMYPDMKNNLVVHLHSIKMFRNKLENTYENYTTYHKLNMFDSILDKYEIDIIHYQHLIHNSPEYAILGRLKKIPQILSLHDYYFICEEHFLETDKYVTCNIPELIGDCIKCLGHKHQVEPYKVFLRRELMKKILEQMSLFIAPSKSLRSDYAKVYPEINEKLKVFPIGVKSPIEKTARKDREGVLHIGIFNYLTFIKGWNLLISVLRILEKENRIKFIVKTKALAPAQVDFLKEFKNVVVDREDIHPVDVAWLPTIAKETFSLVASECLRKGLKLICRNKGAFASRFTDEHAFFYPEDADAEQVAQAIHALLDVDTSLSLSPEGIESVAPSIDFYADQINRCYDMVLQSTLD